MRGRVESVKEVEDAEPVVNVVADRIDPLPLVYATSSRDFH